MWSWSTITMDTTFQDILSASEAADQWLVIQKADKSFMRIPLPSDLNQAVKSHLSSLGMNEEQIESIVQCDVIDSTHALFNQAHPFVSKKLQVTYFAAPRLGALQDYQYASQQKEKYGHLGFVLGNGSARTTVYRDPDDKSQLVHGEIKQGANSLSHVSLGLCAEILKQACADDRTTYNSKKYTEYKKNHSQDKDAAKQMSYSEWAAVTIVKNYQHISIFTDWDGVVEVEFLKLQYEVNRLKARQPRKGESDAEYQEFLAKRKCFANFQQAKANFFKQHRQHMAVNKTAASMNAYQFEKNKAIAVLNAIFLTDAPGRTLLFLDDLEVEILPVVMRFLEENKHLFQQSFLAYHMYSRPKQTALGDLSSYSLPKNSDGHINNPLPQTEKTILTTPEQFIRESGIVTYDKEGKNLGLDLNCNDHYLTISDIEAKILNKHEYHADWLLHILLKACQDSDEQLSNKDQLNTDTQTVIVQGSAKQACSLQEEQQVALTIFLSEVLMQIKYYLSTSTATTFEGVHRDLRRFSQTEKANKSFEYLANALAILDNTNISSNIEPMQRVTFIAAIKAITTMAQLTNFKSQFDLSDFLVFAKTLLLNKNLEVAANLIKSKNNPLTLYTLEKDLKKYKLTIQKLFSTSNRTKMGTMDIGIIAFPDLSSLQVAMQAVTINRPTVPHQPATDRLASSVDVAACQGSFLMASELAAQQALIASILKLHGRQFMQTLPFVVSLIPASTEAQFEPKKGVLNYDGIKVPFIEIPYNIPMFLLHNNIASSQINFHALLASIRHAYAPYTIVGHMHSMAAKYGLSYQKMFGEHKLLQQSLQLSQVATHLLDDYQKFATKSPRWGHFFNQLASQLGIEETDKETIAARYWMQALMLFELGQPIQFIQLDKAYDKRVLQKTMQLFANIYAIKASKRSAQAQFDYAITDGQLFSPPYVHDGDALTASHFDLLEDWGGQPEYHETCHHKVLSSCREAFTREPIVSANAFPVNFGAGDTALINSQQDIERGFNNIGHLVFNPNMRTQDELIRCTIPIDILESLVQYCHWSTSFQTDFTWVTTPRLFKHFFVAMIGDIANQYGAKDDETLISSTTGALNVLMYLSLMPYEQQLLVLKGNRIGIERINHCLDGLLLTSSVSGLEWSNFAMAVNKVWHKRYISRVPTITQYMNDQPYIVQIVNAINEKTKGLGISGLRASAKHKNLRLAELLQGSLLSQQDDLEWFNIPRNQNHQLLQKILANQALKNLFKRYHTHEVHKRITTVSERTQALHDLIDSFIYGHEVDQLAHLIIVAGLAFLYQDAEAAIDDAEDQIMTRYQQHFINIIQGQAFNTVQLNLFFNKLQQWSNKLGCMILPSATSILKHALNIYLLPFKALLCVPLHSLNGLTSLRQQNAQVDIITKRSRLICSPDEWRKYAAAMAMATHQQQDIHQQRFLSTATKAEWFVPFAGMFAIVGLGLWASSVSDGFGNETYPYGLDQHWNLTCGAGTQQLPPPYAYALTKDDWNALYTLGSVKLFNLLSKAAVTQMSSVRNNPNHWLHQLALVMPALTMHVETVLAIFTVVCWGLDKPLFFANIIYRLFYYDIAACFFASRHELTAVVAAPIESLLDGLVLLVKVLDEQVHRPKAPLIKSKLAASDVTLEDQINEVIRTMLQQDQTQQQAQLTKLFNQVAKTNLHQELLDALTNVGGQYIVNKPGWLTTWNANIQYAQARQARFNQRILIARRIMQQLVRNGLKGVLAGLCTSLLVYFVGDGLYALGESYKNPLGTYDLATAESLLLAGNLISSVVSPALNGLVAIPLILLSKQFRYFLGNLSSMAALLYLLMVAQVVLKAEFLREEFHNSTTVKNAFGWNHTDPISPNMQWFHDNEAWFDLGTTLASIVFLGLIVTVGEVKNPSEYPFEAIKWMTLNLMSCSAREAQPQNQPNMSNSRSVSSKYIVKARTTGEKSLPNVAVDDHRNGAGQNKGSSLENNI